MDALEVYDNLALKKSRVVDIDIYVVVLWIEELQAPGFDNNIHTLHHSYYVNMTLTSTPKESDNPQKMFGSSAEAGRCVVDTRRVALEYAKRDAQKPCLCRRNSESQIRG